MLSGYGDAVAAVVYYSYQQKRHHQAGHIFFVIMHSNALVSLVFSYPDNASVLPEPSPCALVSITLAVTEDSFPSVCTELLREKT